MNNIIIGTAGYMLLLSNFILLIFLMKQKYKLRSVPSFYILSISDVLNSVFTAILLLINHIDITVRTNYFRKNKFISNTDTADNYSNTFFRFYETYTNLSDSNYFNQTSCNVKDLLMHNAMFLMPFTNTFISLLIFSIQCNLYAICISDKYNNYLQFLMKIKQDSIMDTVNTNSGNEELKTGKDICKNILYATKLKHKISQFVKFKNISEANKGIVGTSVSVQWLIPIFCTVVLYFADYQNIGIMLQNKTTECMYETPVSFYNCLLEDERIVLMENTHSTFSIIPIYTDYINNSSFIPLFNKNVTENDIISKVYDIMYLVLNHTYDSSNDLERSNFSNIYDLLQIKRNMNAGISAHDITNDINSTNPDTNYNEWTITDDHNIGSNMSPSEKVATIKENYENTNKLLETVVLYNMNKCIISTKFLRLYFLVLMFIIYFLPIMLSFVLQVRGKLVCQNVLSKLKERNSVVYSIPYRKMYMEHDNQVALKNKLQNDSCLSKEYNTEEQGSSNIKIISEYTQDHDKIYEDLLKESIQVQKLFGMLKASLIISIILWTPIFLQAALQVFLCIYVSTWIIDCTFLCAISNCIIRNIFNLNMVKIQEIPQKICRKENTIYPSEENI